MRHLVSALYSRLPDHVSRLAVNGAIAPIKLYYTTSGLIRWRASVLRALRKPAYSLVHNSDLPRIVLIFELNMEPKRSE